MSECHFDLLTDALLGVEHPGGVRTLLTLPGLLAALGKGEAVEFTALRPHQQHAWHAFLVQLAAIALHGAEESSPALDEDEWRAHLRALTDGRDEPWCLMVDDLARPAFMQPPVPDGSLETFKPPVFIPDEIDVLVTAKAHDIKALRMAYARPEHWIYALVTLQTMEGFSGRDNYGITRMKGGYGNRPCVTFARNLGWGARFQRDLAVWQSERAALTSGDSYAYREEGGHALLWLLPWDGKSSLALAECDPFYIEVCRRVRLVAAPRLGVRVRSTMSRRIAEPEGGTTGDVWAPVRRADATVLTVGGKGFDYAATQDLLLGNDWKSAALELRADDGDAPMFVAKTMVRGQGKTEGLHERVLPVPTKVKSLLAKPSERDRLGGLAKRRVEAAGTMRSKVLFPALSLLIAAGEQKQPGGGTRRDGRPDRWTRAFDREVDAIFFKQLWDALEQPETERTLWEGTLERLARDTLDDAIASVPLPTVRRYRAIARAESMFVGCSRKNFPDLHPQGDPAR